MTTPGGPLRVTILTALPVETAAVLAQLEPTEPERIGGSVAHVGMLKDAVLPCKVTVIEVGPGNIETALEAGRIFGDDSADLVLFVGIAGALKDLRLGDVVAATEVVWLHRAKIQGGERQYRAQVHACTRELVHEARYTAQVERWQDRLTETPNATPRALTGQVLSGEELVKDPNYKTLLNVEFSDALAVENEGFALARAGTIGLKVLVIRGASDHADQTKADSDQPAAARAAAAFAAELLNNHLQLLPKPAPLKPVEGEPMAPAPATFESTTAYDRAATGLETLRTDVDLIENDTAAIEDFARIEIEAADHAFRVATVELLASEVDDEGEGLVATRLRTYGRVFAARLVEDDSAVDWDVLLQSTSAGGAVLLAQPQVFPRLGDRERRRVLSGLIGSATAPKPATSLGWRLLLDLTRGDALTPAEAARVSEAQLPASYTVLVDAGATAHELLPKLLDDLEGHEYGAQNRAARFLTASGNPHIDDPSLTSEDRGRLAAALLAAAADGAFGAQDATSRSRMAEWTSDALCAALWHGMTRGSDRLDMPADRLKDVLAAATLGGQLSEVLRMVLDSGLAQTVRPVSGQTVQEDHEWLLKHGKDLPAEARLEWSDFLSALFAQVPRK